MSTDKLDLDVIAPDLVRVVIEVLGDEKSLAPGVKTSTLCAARSPRRARPRKAEAIKKVKRRRRSRAIPHVVVDVAIATRPGLVSGVHCGIMPACRHGEKQSKPARSVHFEYRPPAP
jgi:hypothetical protein